MRVSGAGRVRAVRRGAATAFLISALAVLAAACGGDSDSGGSPASPSTSFPSTTLAGSTQVPALADMLTDKRIGRAEAPNVVILYSSLGCPHCASFHTQSLPTLESQYLDTGVASFVYRDFSLDRTSLLELFAWSEAEFLSRTAGSALRRLRYSQWQRNLAIALGNAPASQAIIDALRRRRTGADALVAEHIDWAIVEQTKKLQITSA